MGYATKKTVSVKIDYALTVVIMGHKVKFPVVINATAEKNDPFDEDGEKNDPFGVEIESISIACFDLDENGKPVFCAWDSALTFDEKYLSQSELNEIEDLLNEAAQDAFELQDFDPRIRTGTKKQLSLRLWEPGTLGKSIGGATLKAFKGPNRARKNSRW